MTTIDSREPQPARMDSSPNNESLYRFRKGSSGRVSTSLLITDWITDSPWLYDDFCPQTSTCRTITHPSILLVLLHFRSATSKELQPFGTARPLIEQLFQ